MERGFRNDMFSSFIFQKHLRITKVFLIFLGKRLLYGFRDFREDDRMVHGQIRENFSIEIDILLF